MLILAVPLYAILQGLFYIIYYKLVAIQPEGQCRYNFKDFLLISSKYLWSGFASFFTQGIDTLEPSLSNRILAACWFLYGIMVVSLWAGNIISFLTVTVYPTPFTNLEELVAQQEYKFGGLGHANFQTTMSGIQKGIFKKMWDRIVEMNHTDPGVLDPDPLKHIAKVKRGKYAYFTDKLIIKMLMAEDCDLVMFDDLYLYSNTYSIGMQNNSAYRQKINLATAELLQSGLVSYWTEIFHSNEKICEKRKDSPKAIQLSHIHQVFYCLLVFLILSTILLLVEFLWKRYYCNGKGKYKVH